MPAAPAQDGATPYTLHEAAQLLGVSLNTVRRKISRGELKATQVQRPQGHVWHVWLERTQDAAQHPTQGSTQHPTQDAAQHPPTANGQVTSILSADRAEQLTAALVPLVEAAVAPLRAELTDVRALLSARDQELGAIRLERDQLAEQFHALQVDAAEIALSVDSERAAVEPTQTSSAPAQRAPWWRRWLSA